MSRIFLLCLLLLAFVCRLPAAVTERLYLSGTGRGDAVQWEFFCTEGRNSRTWSTIAVPSCWEQQGFGTYNYGGSMQHGTGDVVGNEQGLYRRTFTVPAAWQGRVVRLVFDGSMTDTSVWVNGKSAGPTHQGAFYSFGYDITSLIRLGEENLLEVTVAKNSSNRSVNDAERAADYWIFGGIYRPVWLEALPAQHIAWTAIDAGADGRFTAEIHLGVPATAGGVVRAQILDAEGRPFGEPLAAAVAAGASKALVSGTFSGAHLWTAETPCLYRVNFEFLPESAGGVANEKAPFSGHLVSERFGFRTIEVRENDGVYLNGTKIVLKGVNRHCFWPETARTVSREQSYLDARLIKAANMNAVRMSHYPPDRDFLEACDELGLYVLDELGGWQKPYDVPTGARLIGELVRRDVNHPCIVMLDNGNEGGWKAENDVEFGKWDPQKRAVLHPWAINSGINTDHYEKYDSTVKLSAGPQLFMPTEFLHGLYDGGIGAGLRDYWDVMGKSPTVAGGFFWNWSDEGVVRTDQGGRLDTVGNQAPDGMTGPHREPEGSYYTVKAIWAPVQISTTLTARGELPVNWDGRLTLENHYDFRNLSTCRFAWDGLDSEGNVTCSQTLKEPDVKAHGIGQLLIAPAALAASIAVVRLHAYSAEGLEIFTWSWLREKSAPVEAAHAAGDLVVAADKAVQSSGIPGLGEAQVVAFKYDNKTFQPVQQGVTLVAIHWSDTAEGGRRCDFSYSVDAEVDILGLSFSLPEGSLKAKRWLGRGPYRVYRNRQEGGVVGVHELAFNDPIPGRSFDYPEFKGYFRDWRWLQLQTDKGRITVENVSGVPYFGLQAPRDGEPSMQVFPDTGLSFLEVIPGIGSKFSTPADSGPQGRTPHVSGVRSGSLVFRYAR